MPANSWIEYATDTNDVATATKAAASGVQHVIRSVSGGYSDLTATGTVTVKDGTTTIGVFAINGSGHFTLPEGVSITRGNLVSAAISAGGASVDGYVVLTGASQ